VLAHTGWHADGECVDEFADPRLTWGQVRLVRTSRIPQLMSKPIPPGEMTPTSGSIAATPPIGKP
jgi:hypothetical protein